MTAAGTEARTPRDLDWVLMGAAAALAAIGVAFVHSATMSSHGLSGMAVRQLVSVGLGVVTVAVILRFDYRTLVRLAPWAYGICLALNVLVLAFGKEVGGNRNWLRLGPASMQPSEFLKVATVLMLATVMARRQPAGFSLTDALLPAGIVLLPIALVQLQGDTGTALTFCPLLAVYVFVSGLRWRFIIAGLIALVLVSPLGWKFFLKPHQKKRIEIMFNPELDPSGTGYHALQARIAIGSGGFLGQGYTKGPQNRLGFIPDSHTDFIFSIIAEEWGFLGAALVVALFAVVLKRLADAVVLARERLGALLCLGALVLIGVHVVINLGMVVGLLPVIGITLPIVSYGGSSMLSVAALIGLALDVRFRRFGR